MRKVYAVDFETFYSRDKRDPYSLSSMSTWNYVFDKRFDAYLVAVVGEDGYEWVGRPSLFDWDILDGALLAMHNAYFDGLVLRRLHKDGVAPGHVAKASLFDTADMAGYLKIKRNLANVVSVLFKETLVKEVRDYMDGKTYEDAIKEGREQDLLKYAATDAQWTRRICVEKGNLWPERELELSRINREAGWRGLPCNVELVKESYEKISALRTKYLQDIPWVGELDEKGKPYPPLSLKALRIWGRKVGIPVPSSLAKTSRDANEWEEKYGEQYPWVCAVRHYRRVNTLLLKIENIKNNIREDGSMAFSLIYHGANTGRPSSGFYDENDEKVNILNLPKQEQYGVNLRHFFIAPKSFWEGFPLV